MATRGVLQHPPDVAPLRICLAEGDSDGELGVVELAAADRAPG
jgi:hypothetical protein